MGLTNRIRLFALAVVFLAGAASAADVPKKEPGPKTRGKRYEWQAKDGLVYHYYVPKKYDPKKGANLTLILHGSNSNHGWGMVNNTPPGFRPDDIVVSPDGTTFNGKKGYNFLGRPGDAERLRALHKEFQETYKINATFLYGHSQGSFFALYYAGLYPEDVQGVVAHASGSWMQTKFGKECHHQAIVFMHGTQDPVVAYALSVGAYGLWREAGYPMVRLRSLENWNHWPAEHNGNIRHTSQQIAWCEGMTTTDPDRLRVCFEFIANCKQKARTDYNAVYTLSKRIQTIPFAPISIRKRADKAVAAIEKLAAAHIAKVPATPPEKYAVKEWMIHIQLILRTFADTDACREFAKGWQEALDNQQKLALVEIGKYWSAKGPKAGFEAWVNALEVGPLYFRCHDNKVFKNLKKWRGEARQHGIDKRMLKRYDAIVPKLEKATKAAYRDFDGLNRKCGKF